MLSHISVSPSIPLVNVYNISISSTLPLPPPPPLQRAKQAGLHITVHAAESGPAENVRQAIELLGAKRIGHGYHVLEDSAVYQLAKDTDVHFEVALCSVCILSEAMLHKYS